jgi:hypothetical protein
VTAYSVLSTEYPVLRPHNAARGTETAMTTRALAPGFCALAVVLLCGCQSDRPADADDPLPEIEVPVLGPVGEVRGLEWPASPHDGKPERRAILDQPCMLTLRFPSGRKERLFTRTSWVTQAGGTVTEVTVLPSKRLAPFADAVNDCEALLKQLGAVDQQGIKEKLREWRATPPRFPVSTGALLERRVGVFILIKTLDGVNRPEGDWFLKVSFETYDEQGWALREAWDPAVWKKLDGGASKKKADPK